MSNEINSSTVMTRPEAREYNKEVIETNKEKHCRIGRFILSEERTKLLFNSLGAGLIVSFVGAVFAASAKSSDTVTNADSITIALILAPFVLLFLITVIVLHFCDSSIQRNEISHSIYKGDIFKLQDNKFQTPIYIRVVDCDYVKNIYLVETLLPKEQQATRSRFLTDGGLTPNHNNHNTGKNKPDTMVMTLEEIYRKGGNVWKDDPGLDCFL